MATNLTIRGVPVTFPFEPYELQKEYMDKVIECLQNETNGVLESPTGTGKTLSLLCASLAWLTGKKAQVQAEHYTTMGVVGDGDDFLKTLQEDIDKKVGMANVAGFFRAPTIIYASRTHSQLSQAMQELKRTAYTNMKASVVGSREQMCIHPDIIQEELYSAKIQLCRAKVQSKSCHFHNRVEKLKDDPAVVNMAVMDIEDLVALGQSKGFCPYYMAKDLKQRADIIFLPYNYLFDARASKNLGIELQNTVVILDEAHNIEHVCEESASMQLKSTDITLCIEEVTEVMKAMTEAPLLFDTDEGARDFSADELCVLKEILLNFEKALDKIELKLPLSEGTTFDGDYIYEIFQKSGVLYDNSGSLETLVDKIVLFLSSTAAGPFQRKGNGLDLFSTLVKIVFGSNAPEFREKIKKCFKVHVGVEEPEKKPANNWLSKNTSTTKPGGRVLSFWCFSPGFGMNMLIRRGVKCVILTSGTLAPLKPLISELELDVQVQLENPHIIKSNQITVKIVSKGPDGTELNSNFQNRNNPQYISSLGRTILNLIRMIPHGLLVFFPSYPILQKCQRDWQEEGIWSSICDLKPIYVEPRRKEAFIAAMNEYYTRVQDPNSKGAIFMGVCRGKISEGLDFADNNGRAVIITGLPYPPLKDPRVVLKRQYLDLCNRQNKDFPTGADWYSLEASRAINQAMGRVIRHQHDFGAIILLDSRFQQSKIKSQMSLWIRNQIQSVNNFGEIIRDLKKFFIFTCTNLPQPKLKPASAQPPAEFDTPTTYSKKGNFDFSTSSLNKDSTGLVNIYQKKLKPANVNLADLRTIPSSSSSNNNPKTFQTNSDHIGAGTKRKRVSLVSSCTSTTTSPTNTSTQEYIVMVRTALNSEDFKIFISALQHYRDTDQFDVLISKLDAIFLDKYNIRYVIQGLSPYIKMIHKGRFEDYWEKMR